MAFVYFFKHNGINGIKIGMTKNNDSVANRFSAFNTHSPSGSEIIGVIETDRPDKLEKELHRKFANRRMNGEFFNISKETVLTLTFNTSEKKLLSIFRGLNNLHQNAVVEFAKAQTKTEFLEQKMSLILIEERNLTIIKTIVEFMKNKQLDNMLFSYYDLKRLLPNYNKSEIKHTLVVNLGLRLNPPKYYKDFDNFGRTNRCYNLNLVTLQQYYNQAIRVLK